MKAKFAGWRYIADSRRPGDLVSKKLGKVFAVLKSQALQGPMIRKLEGVRIRMVKRILKRKHNTRVSFYLRTWRKKALSFEP